MTYELCHFSQWSYHLAKWGKKICFLKKTFWSKNFFWWKIIIWGVFVVFSLSSALSPLLLFPGLHSSPHWMPLSKVPKFPAQVAQKLFWGGHGSIVIWVKLNKEKKYLLHSRCQINALHFSTKDWELKLLLLLSRFSRVQLLATPWTAAYQTPQSMGFSRQEYWIGMPLPSHYKCWARANYMPGTVLNSRDISV